MIGEKTPLLPKQDFGYRDINSDDTSSSSMSTKVDVQQIDYVNPANQLSDQPWKYKMVALLCAMFLAVGSHFAAHTLGAMKSIIKKEFNISNSQYGTIQSSVSVVNTVLPLIGGIFVDAFGTIPGSIVTTVLIAMGNILVAASTSTTSLSTMIFGRVLYGIGSGTVVIVQETILSQWFKGRSLAAVIALMMTISRLSSFLAQATVVPIASWLGWYGYGFWFSAILCIFSFLINLIYIVLLKRVSSNQQDCQVQQSAHRRKSFSWSKLMYLPHSFWLIASMEFLLGGGWGCFLHINSEYVKFRFGFNDRTAAGVASVAQVLPIFLMPMLGIFADRYGKRTWMMIGSGASFLLALLLLEYTPIHPIVGMISFSVSLALGPVALVSSVPLILPLSLVGTGMGLIKSGTNVGASIFDILTGLLQDHDAHRGYGSVIDFFIIIVTLSILSGITLLILNRIMYGNLLDSASSAETKQEQLTERLKSNYFYAGIYIVLVIVSWIMFIRFMFK
ncbi:Major facilitator super domain-containing protein 1 [Rhizopus azygosporus]|uniref:Lysosomal dipeptide transporter MFSD1 n=1 Tax=Rhizopus azygosporus TaxID=86630 RepID=A0A367J990_RHIAZ|nr:Major facilitator super domain-containing protein 1 [Rhizopus azygosporus]